MNFISFFAGIGGFDLGLERAGHKCVAQVEIDPFCLKVLTKHWPNVPKFGDIRELTGKELPEADLWCGGFPCTNISNAGNMEGITGEESKLWFDFSRLFRVARPRFVVVENVAAILHRGMGDVLADLAASGYDAHWFVLPAGAFGAPHFRSRLFIIAQSKLAIPYPDTRPCGFEDWRAFGGFGYQGDRHQEWDIYRQGCQPGVPRVAYGVPDRMDRHKCCANAVVPQVAEYVGRLLNEAVANRDG
jgi:DNA (cytosine-5)-methyltransferase 1